MLRLSKITDYGMLLMSHLAASEQPVWKANGLSLATGVPAPTVSKVLQSLLNKNLLVSQRGAQGGYRLARQPSAITVKEVVDALEGEIALTECNSDHSQCDQQHDCALRGNWQRINEAMRTLLNSITLADMAGEDFQPRFVHQPTIHHHHTTPIYLEES
ncbi:MAG: SUF system Fe-S cluster assembly regulator [Mariprofundales bacterium]|nr:SUF system Fe-S cluster assembly regulator [Mariprofundales bacterium]